MAFLTGLTLGGDPWTPQFLKTINWATCLGCGRCFKACGRGVMALIALNDEGAIVDEDDDDDEVERKVMAIVKAENCIGCQACDRVCPKACHTYEPALA
ncbi:ferredoxin III, nif-specific [Nodosilinea nodulosa]|uniref:ferredoxin III, nif-specific n=1 Tax=Nodosilinea nodulosa TaxID=416001 RepID=UPI00031A0BBF|nr:ferredoxin III, nif-specific [Nodosilinea nodulosa]